MGRVLRHCGLHEEPGDLENEDRHDEQQTDDQGELGQRAAAPPNSANTPPMGSWSSTLAATFTIRIVAGPR
jgi:hypothetical protein